MVEFVEKQVKKVDVWKLKKYVCTVKPIDIHTGKNVIVLNKAEAQEHDIYYGYRTEVCVNGKCLAALVDVSDGNVKPGEVGVFREIAASLRLKKGQKVEIVHLDRPASIGYIKKKLEKGTLSEPEVKTIVDDIMHDRLSEVETSAWITSAFINGFSDDEVISLTNATVESGDRLNLGKGPILDKHCIGGVAGNRTTMMVVPIIASAGLYIPKTSSRSITSAAGTADTMEVLCGVSFEINELRRMVLKSKGAIVWGGGMNLAPVDDRLIRIRHPLSLDPEGMLLASILAKKKCVGAKYVLIDIPVGRGVKIPHVDRGNQLAQHFLSVGRKLGLQIECIITDGAEPVGHGIGTGLECRDVLQALSGKGPDDLRHKSYLMAGKLLELSGKVRKGDGYKTAESIVINGKAMKKFREIIDNQGGNSKVKESDLPIGQHTYDVLSEVSGSIFHLDNKTMSKLARIAGAPRDSGAGIFLHKGRGDHVNKGDALFTIHAESESKLDFALKALKDLEPVEMRKMLLGTMQ